MEDLRGKIAFVYILGSQTKIDDLRLKCCILRANPKNKSSGSNQYRTQHCL